MASELDNTYEFEVLDSGDPQGLRYHIHAHTHDGGDQVGEVHVASAPDQETAELVWNALEFWHSMRNTPAHQRFYRRHIYRREVTRG